MDVDSANYDAEDLERYKHLIGELEEDHEEGAPVRLCISESQSQLGYHRGEAEDKLEYLRKLGEVYESRTDYLRTT